MRAMVIDRPGERLKLETRKLPRPGHGQVLLKVRACGVCRTDLHVVDGELPQCRYPVVPGHEIVGEVAELGPGVTDFAFGERLGVPWLGGACGHCRFCVSGEENLCDEARFTGCQIDGGYQDYVAANADFCFRIPDNYKDAEAAPLLCAGLIGHRAHRMAGGAERLGIYGFGAAAHIMAQVARHQGQRVFAFVRPSDFAAREFATTLGAEWVGGSDETPPEPLDAADHLRPGRRARAGRPPGRPQGRPGHRRRHPYERHSRRSRTRSCGASASFVPSPTLPAPTATTSCGSPATSRSG